MQTPTTIQIRTAMEVLQKLGERINEHAARSPDRCPALIRPDCCWDKSL